MPLILVLGIANYSVKRQRIGGWLLFFCGQISIGTLGALLMVLSNYHLYLAPERLGLQRWLALLVVQCAPLFTGIATIVAAAFLLVEQTWDAVMRLRYVLIAHACAAALAILIDFKYFPSALPERLGAAAMTAVWIAYFYMSLRVQSVFLTRDWDRYQS
jgi:hypothetical protein